MPVKILHKLDSIVITLIFCVSIFTPFTYSFIDDDKKVSIIEKRKLAPIPDTPYNGKDISDYPQKFNAYYADQFGFREWFYQIYNHLMLKIDRASVSSDVTFGKDGWMFLGTLKPGYNKYGDPMRDAINASQYSDNQLEQFSTSIVATRDWLNDRGIEYLYVIAPNKHTIYFENIPSYIKKLNEKSATDQLLEHLRKHTDIRVLDLRQSFMDQKNTKQLFYKTDTHWNHNGANIAQHEIMKEVESIFPGKIQPYKLDDSEYVTTTKTDGDLATFANLDNVSEESLKPDFRQTCTPTKEPANAKWNVPFTTSCEGQELTAVIFRDSFFSYLEPYFARKFNRSTYIWKGLNRSDLEKFVSQENPDIVIESIVERILPEVMPTPEFIQPGIML